MEKKRDEYVGVLRLGESVEPEIEKKNKNDKNNSDKGRKIHSKNF